MPEKGIIPKSPDEILKFEEIEKIVQILVLRDSVIYP